MQMKPRILVVDDQSQNVEILSNRLRLEGYEVLTATDGAEAIVIAKDRHPDLILLDVIMPDPDGFEVCRRLKADTTLPFMPILMVTAKAEPQDIIAGFEAGADDYLTKPLNRNVLVARVMAQLRSKARHDAERDKSLQLEQQVADWEAWSRDLESQLLNDVTDLERMGLLQRFLSPEVIEEVISLGDEDVWTVTRKEVTVLSCVLHGFETFVEMTESTGVFEMLRDYEEVLSLFINGFGGRVAWFASDEFQFMFDASSSNHRVEQAVRMAVSMREPLVSQCEKWQSRRYGLDIGIGIAHGEVSFGLTELGSRLDYTVIGAVRHLASRLGKQARGANVLISQLVWEKVEKQFHAQGVGQLVLSGDTDPIPFFEVKGEVEDPI